jgi:hypothetical protein
MKNKFRYCLSIASLIFASLTFNAALAQQPAKSNHPSPLPWKPGTVSGAPLKFPAAPADKLGDRSAQIFTTHVKTFCYPSKTHAYNTFYPTDKLNFTAAVYLPVYSGGFHATGWEVTDIDNNVQSTGSFGALDYNNTQFQACFFTVPMPAKLGWYRIRLIGPVVDPNFGNSYGGATFCIVTPDSNFAPIAEATNSYLPPDSKMHDSGGNGNLQTFHGMFDTGMYRLSFPAQSGTRAQKVAATQTVAKNHLSDMALDAERGWTAMKVDAAHPHISCADFPYFDATADDIAQVTAAAAILKDSVVWEGVNEPDGRGASGYFPNSEAFYKAVKAGYGSAKVIGPCPTTINNLTRDFLTSFFKMSPHLDAISFHPYNGFQGDAWLADTCMSGFKHILTATGNDSKPIYCTEYGDSKCSEYGLQCSRRFLQYIITSALTLIRWGVPANHVCQFYDMSHGFWSFPSWHCLSGRLDSGVSPYSYAFPMPTAPAFRVLSSELRGKMRCFELNCGNAHDFIRTYQHDDGDGHYVTSFFTQGMEALRITVSGGISAIDVFGNAVNLNGGTFNITDLPIYVRSRSPLKISDIGNGLMNAKNIATLATASVASGMDTTNVARINNGMQESCYLDNVSTSGGATSPYNDTKNVMPAQATLTWSSPQTIKRLGIFFAPPYQLMDSAIAFNVEAMISGKWKQIATYTNHTAYSVPFADVGTGGTYETSYNGEWVFHFVLPSAISTSAVRVNLTKSSHGYTPDDQGLRVAAPQGGAQHLTLREFKAYSN